MVHPQAFIPIGTLMFVNFFIIWQERTACYHELSRTTGMPFILRSFRAGNLENINGNVATVLLAIYAYQPTIREKLPPSPVVTATDAVL